MLNLATWEEGSPSISTERPPGNTCVSQEDPEEQAHTEIQIHEDRTDKLSEESRAKEKKKTQRWPPTHTQLIRQHPKFFCLQRLWSRDLPQSPRVLYPSTRQPSSLDFCSSGKRKKDKRRRHRNLPAQRTTRIGNDEEKQRRVEAACVREQRSLSTASPLFSSSSTTRAHWRQKRESRERWTSSLWFPVRTGTNRHAATPKTRPANNNIPLGCTDKRRSRTWSVPFLS